MGFPFAAGRNPDDVQFHADRRAKSPAVVQALYEGLCCQPSKCGFLQLAVQKQAQCLQEPCEKQRSGLTIKLKKLKIRLYIHANMDYNISVKGSLL